MHKDVGVLSLTLALWEEYYSAHCADEETKARQN